MSTFTVPGKGSPQHTPKPSLGEAGVSIEHYLAILFHRKWLILIIFVLVSVGTIIVAHYLPDIYSSETIVLVDPQKVPDSYVKPTVSGDVRNRLGSLAQQILSATRLQKIMGTFNLYPEERKKLPREDVILLMRKDILGPSVVSNFGGKENLQAFKIGYSGKDPKTVAQVANELASLFIEENLKEREQMATGTTSFIDSQLESTRKQLQEQEDKMKEFTTKHQGELPEQQGSNNQKLVQSQARLQALSEVIYRAEARKSYLQAIIDGQPLPEPAPRRNAPQNVPRPKAPTVPSTPQNSSEALLAQMLSHYGESHPDVKRLRALIEEERRKKEETAREAEAEQKDMNWNQQPAVAATEEDPLAQQTPPAQRSIPVAVRAQMEAIDAEIAKDKADQAEIAKTIADYQEKIAAGPGIEQETTGLMRDYEITKGQYSGLLQKKFTADMGTQLEISQQGEKFTILDPAQVAQKPSTPNRTAIDAAGSAGGLALGFIVALSTEFLGLSITSPSQVTMAAGFAVLGVIPVIITPFDRQRRKRRMLYGMTSGAVMVLTIAGYLLYHYRDQIFG